MKKNTLIKLALFLGISALLLQKNHAQPVPEGWRQWETTCPYSINKSGQFFGNPLASASDDFYRLRNHRQMMYHFDALSPLKYPKEGVHHLRGIHFIDSVTGFAFGTGINSNTGYPIANCIWKTTDAGNTYTQLNSPIADSVNTGVFIYRVIEISKDTLFFISPISIAATFNGGAQFHTIHLPAHFTPNSINFMNSKLGVVAGSYDTATFPNGAPAILVTTNGGTSFEAVTANIPNSSFVNAIYAKFLHDNYLLINVVEEFSTASACLSYVSRNKGLSFTQLPKAYSRIYEAFDTLTMIGGGEDVASPPKLTLDGFTTTRDMGHMWPLQNYKLIRSNEAIYIYGDNYLTTSPPIGTAFKIFQYRFEPFKVVNLEAYANVTPNPVNPLNLHRKGSPFRFKLKLKNTDELDYLTVKGTLQSLDPGMPVTDNAATFNNLLKNTEVLSGDEYEIMLNEKTIDIYGGNGAYDHPNFELLLSDQFSNLPVKKIMLCLNFNPIKDTSHFKQALVDDDSNPDSQGDNDGVMEKNETIEVLPQFNAIPSNTNFLGFKDAMEKLEGKLICPVASVDIWNNRSGSTGIVNNKYEYNVTYENQPPYATIIKPTQDYVLTYNLNSTYKIPFQTVFTRSVRFTNIDDITTPPPYPGSFDVRWTEDFELNKAFPAIPFASITRPQLNEVFTIDKPNKIKWTTNHTGTIRIDYSATAGADWATIATNVNAQALEYTWTPADTLNIDPTALIRIVMLPDTSIAYLSNTFVLDILNGVNEQKTQQFSFSLYPNPASNFVTVSNIATGSTLKVFTVTGEVVYSTVATHYATINTTNFANGIYFIQVENKGQLATKKFVVNK